MEEFNQLYLDDYIDAFAVHHRRWWLLAVGIALLTLVISFPLYVSAQSSGDYQVFLTVLLTGVILTGIWFFARNPKFMGRRLRKQLDDLGDDALRVRYEFEADIWIIQTPKSVVRLDADDFVAVKRDDKVTLMYRTRVFFQIVPRRLLTAELESFIAQVENRLKQS